jgi:hypothetical protein
MTKNDAWWWALLAVMLTAIFAHAYLPRYEWREIRDPNSLSIGVHDKWTGRVQRAVYADSGSFKVMDVYTPF